MALIVTAAVAIGVGVSRPWETDEGEGDEDMPSIIGSVAVGP